jgi:hypothetical protein
MSSEHAEGLTFFTPTSVDDPTSADDLKKKLKEVKDTKESLAIDFSAIRKDITDESLITIFKDCSTLVGVKLHNCNVTSYGLKPLGDNNSNIIFLDLSACTSLTGTDIIGIAGSYTNLKNVNLTGLGEITAHEFLEFKALCSADTIIAADSQSLSNDDKTMLAEKGIIVPGKDTGFAAREMTARAEDRAAGIGR